MEHSPGVTLREIEPLDADWWRRIKGPTAHARGLPNVYYLSDHVLEHERRRLFFKTWCLAGRVSELPVIGAAVPIEVAGQPLIMIRVAEQQVSVFHNVCPHRGARLVSDYCELGASLVCPYHAWTYALDGQLKSRPHFGGPGVHDTTGGDSGGTISLAEVRSRTWFDWVFVDLSGLAPDFDQHLQPVLRRLSDFPLDQFDYYDSLRCEFAANWKLVAENYFDVYHVFRVHPDLNRMYGGPRTSNHIDGILLYNEYFASTQDRGGGLPEPDGLPESWSRRVLFGNLFPNLGISVYPSSVYLVEFVPLAPDRTAMQMHFYFARDAVGNAATEQGRASVLAWWRELNGEDEQVCELLQLGRQSSAYPGGRLAPHWDRATQHFARLIAEALHGDTQ